MGHYREPRPQAWEDRMKGVERCYSTVKRINNAPFRGFSTWEQGSHIIPPARRRILKLIRDTALNRGFKPRLGLPMDVDVNHTRNVKAMVRRIIHQNNPWQRRLNPHNVDLHPAFLRRPVQPPPPRPKAKRKPDWNKSPLTHGRHSPYLTSDERHRVFLNRVRAPDIPVRRVSAYIKRSDIRDGTPLHMTPKLTTKLIDATHRLAKRSRFDFRKSTVQPKTLLNDADMVQIYSKVLYLPDGVSFYTPCPYIKKNKTEKGYTRYWYYDMDNKDLPCDLKITPSDHAIDDPIRPGSSPPNLDPFTEPRVLYDEDMKPLDHLPSTMSSPSSFGMHGYGSLPGWAPVGPNDFFEREYVFTGSEGSGGRSPKSVYNEATAPMTPVPPCNSGTASPLYSYDPSISRNLAPNWISPFYSFDKTNFRNDDGGISRPPSVKRPNSAEERPTSANLQAGTLGSEMSARFGGFCRSLPSSPGHLTPKSAIFQPELASEGSDWQPPAFSSSPYRPTDDPPWKRHECCEDPC